MRVIIADTNHRIFTIIYQDSIRIPVKGDYLCFNMTQQMNTTSEEPQIAEGIVLKVMIDYVQDAVIVTINSE